MNRPHVYVHSDIPEGMTLTEWRGMVSPRRVSLRRRIVNRLRKKAKDE